LRYLVYRPRSEAETRIYLAKRGYTPVAAETAIEKLRSLNYLNDAAFARDWALRRAETYGFGPKRIEQELKSKGIDRVRIQAALHEVFAQIDPADRAERLLAKHFRTDDLTDPKILRRAAAFLRRRGYGSNVVFNLLGYSVEDDEP
jgi:regulatory protein